MRKITMDATEALYKGRDFKQGNTQVLAFFDFTELRLFGNLIARVGGDGIFVTLAGWNTVTTRERLNGVLSELGLSIHTRKGDVYMTKIGGDPILWENPNELTKVES